MVIDLHFKLYLKFILLISFFKLINNSEINIIIEGEEEIDILNNSFYLDPSEVIVNGESKPNCKKSCLFVGGLNNVTIKFDNKIESCKGMFYGLKKL